jgi:hypothetical protein
MTVRMGKGGDRISTKSRARVLCFVRVVASGVLRKETRRVVASPK